VACACALSPAPSHPQSLPQKSSPTFSGASVDSASVGAVPDLEIVLAGLNEAQREACLELRGPVAILAGAGTGKTTTITHRIACQVRSRMFVPSQILAVTFTDKAAGELRSRLAALRVEGVEARTFTRPRSRSFSRTSAPALTSGYRVTAMSATIGRASRSKSAYETLMVTVCEPAWNTIRSFLPSAWST
jgi:hypothetical protein